MESARKTTARVVGPPPATVFYPDGIPMMLNLPNSQSDFNPELVQTLYGERRMPFPGSIMLESGTEL